MRVAVAANGAVIKQAVPAAAGGMLPGAGECARLIAPTVGGVAGVVK